MTLIQEILDYPEFASVRRKLTRRGLIPYADHHSTWESYIVNQNTNSRVVVGEAMYPEPPYELSQGRVICVAIYLTKVYEIDNPNDWKNRDKPIPVIY